MHISFINSLATLTPDEWNAVTGTDYPFTRYEFLHALEASGATDTHHDGKSGWQTHHLLAHDDNNQLIAVMPLYLKYHSYGEYVFDWAWANAYHQHGLDYYPKLLAAIPYTPATGPRLCIHPDYNGPDLLPNICQALQQEAERQQASSIHILFPEQPVNRQLAEQQLDARLGTQYHWFNQDFRDFNDFLDTFSSRKRKNLKKERRRVQEQGLRLEILNGPEIDPQLWQRFYYFYQLTYAKRSGHGGYLEQDFFQRIAASMPEHLVLVLAYDDTRDTQPIAGALNFRDSRTLYGRYWGCLAEYDFLHFETCYYQGIDYCIAQRLKRFDPGAQGEHKIQRGFTPILTYSNHWIAHTDFRRAIQDFLRRENHAIQGYLQQASELLPFKHHQRENR